MFFVKKCYYLVSGASDIIILSHLSIWFKCSFNCTCEGTDNFTSLRTVTTHPVLRTSSINQMFNILLNNFSTNIKFVKFWLFLFKGTLTEGILLTYQFILNLWLFFIVWKVTKCRVELLLGRHNLFWIKGMFILK